MSSRSFWRLILPLAALLAPIPMALVAEDFTFRRIGVGGTAEGSRRITVQVDPEEQARRLAPRPTVTAPVATPVPASTGSAAPTPPGARYGWFWTAVSPDRDRTEGRYLAAMAALDRASDAERVRQPSVQHLQDIAQQHGQQILRASIGTRVSPALALAVISVESAGRADARSSAGAQGLMQLIPATAERFGVSDAMDPGQNIQGGVAYLDWLLGEFSGDVVLALAGYNAGEGAVRRNNGVPPYAETRDYVPKVLAAWSVARGLCATVPQLPTDGCVFVIGASG